MPVSIGKLSDLIGFTSWSTLGKCRSCTSELLSPPICLTFTDFTISQIRRLDLHVDKFQLYSNRSRQDSIASGADFYAERRESPRTTKLKTIIRALSTTSTSKPQISASRLLRLLDQAKESGHEGDIHSAQSGDEEDLEWIMIAKAAVQAYGLVMETLLQQLAPIPDELWYWDDVLTSYTSTSIYTVQTAPVRLIARGKEVWADARHRYRSQTVGTESLQQSLSEQWRRFYGLVQQSIAERSFAHARTTVLSPFALARSEAQKKQNGLRKIRELSASGLGVLVAEGLSFPTIEQLFSTAGIDSPKIDHDDWRSTLEKSVTLLDGILMNVCSLEVNTRDFEEQLFVQVDYESEAFTQQVQDGRPKCQIMIGRLEKLIKERIPLQIEASNECFSKYGRPSRLVRYWLPGVLLILSGSTILKIVANRRQEIVTWIQEFGATARDFWFNWVVSPVKKLIGTIRHDEQSEVAIMSKDSLRADRESLERMVVEFASDHPENGTGYDQAQLDEISLKVKEGDLTPVLRAYERDLRKPFIGTVRGDLVRALLIQVQKTKVDVEVAIGGIDSLLKSQELVFGFVGLTPGLLVSFAVLRWLNSAFGSRPRARIHKQQGETIRTLRLVYTFPLYWFETTDLFTETLIAYSRTQHSLITACCVTKTMA